MCSSGVVKQNKLYFEVQFGESLFGNKKRRMF